MLSRRREMSESELKRAAKNLLDDGTMNTVIQGQRFMKFTSEDDDDRYKFARLAEPRPLFGRDDQIPEESEDEILFVGGYDRHQGRKKQRSVRIETHRTQKARFDAS